MTGEAWNEIMHALGRNEAFLRGIAGTPCVEEMVITADNYAELLAAGRIEHPDECGKSTWSILYFLTFTMIVTFVCLNLVIAVVLEGFADAGKGDEREILAKCTKLWKSYDPECTLLIPVRSA